MWAGSFAPALFAVAPFQCPHAPDPKEVREDTPGEALYGLAHQFADAGDKDAEIKTLEYIADRYPRSHYAATAREELKQLGVALPASSVAVDLKNEGVPLGRMPGDPSATAASSAGPAPSATAAPSGSARAPRP